jgi:hypothetical protein
VSAEWTNVEQQSKNNKGLKKSIKLSTVGCLKLLLSVFCVPLLGLALKSIFFNSFNTLKDLVPIYQTSRRRYPLRSPLYGRHFSNLQYYTILPWMWGPKVAPQRWYLSTKLHGVTSKNSNHCKYLKFDISTLKKEDTSSADWKSMGSLISLVKNVCM